jgi:HSP20 family protein
MVLRYDPFRFVSYLVDTQIAELDRLTESPGQRIVANMAPMDAYREGEQFHVLIDLPGVSPSDIDLTVHKEVLTVKVERKWRPREGVETLVAERPQGSVTRRLYIGETVAPDTIQAIYDQGVLHLTIPMAEQADVHKVEVTTKFGTDATVIETTYSA